MTNEEKVELQIPENRIYYTVDHKSLMLSGVSWQENFIGFKLRLNICDRKVRSDCYPDEIIQALIVSSSFQMFSKTNFIDFFEVESEEETLKRQEVNHIFEMGRYRTQIDSVIAINESRAELIDSRVPLLLFDALKEYRYLNLEPRPIVTKEELFTGKE